MNKVEPRLRLTALTRRTLMKAAGCAVGISAVSSRLAFAQDMHKIAIAIAAGLDTSPQFAGIDLGIFEKNGLELSPNIKTSGVELLNSLVSGESLISIVGVTVMASAVQNGIPIKIIALEHGTPISDNYSTDRVVAGPDSGIVQGDLATLKGKTIGTPLGTDGEAGVLAYLDSVGLSKADVKLVQTAPPDMASAIQSGSVDAVSFVEPWATIVETSVPGAFRVVKEQPQFFSPGIIITSDDFLAKERDLLVQYLTGVAAAMKWARANLHGELLDVNSRWTQIPREVADKAIDEINFDTRLSKHTLRALENNNQPALVSLGVLKEPLPLDKLIDTSLQKEVQDAHPELFDDLPPIPKEDML